MTATAYEEKARPEVFGLEELIEPFDRDHFVEQYWNREFLHLTGAADRFEPLFPWARLNDVLASNRMRAPRFRLAHKGKIVEAREYNTVYGNEVRIATHALYEKIRQGATLIVDHAEELSSPLGELTAMLENWTRARVNANLYASWREDSGFKLHWDPQDTFIIQVSGRKRWTVYRPTRECPVQGDTEAQAPLPTDDPVFDGHLESGSVLYVPRGWWHLVTPVGEPCMHLTITFNLHKSTDLLSYAVDQFKANVLGRRDLPVFESAAEQAAFTAHLFQEFAASLEPNLMTKFFEYYDDSAVGLPRFHLPEAIDERFGPDRLDGVRLVSPRRLHLANNGNGTVSFRAQSKSWTLPEKAVRTIEALNSGEQRVAVETLFDGADKTTVLATLGELARRGLIEIV